MIMTVTVAIVIAILTGFRAAEAGKNPLLWAIIGFVTLFFAQTVFAAFVAMLIVFTGHGSATTGHTFGFIIGLALGILAAFAFLKKLLPDVKFVANSPDGIPREYATLNDLKQDFLNGKITSECVARRQGETNFRPISDVLFSPSPKSKTTALLLAVFLGFWTWYYTYKRDAWKFWLNLILIVATLGYYSVIAWIWAIIDVLVKQEGFYSDFPNKQ